MKSSSSEQEKFWNDRIEKAGRSSENDQAPFRLTKAVDAKKMLLPRKPLSHKGTFGHAAIVAGSYGMMGAAVLASMACLRSGVGKLTIFIPECGYDILQGTVPEAMCKVSGKKHIINVDDTHHFDAIGIGPGIGQYASHRNLLESLYSRYKKPMVIDADALNSMAGEPSLLQSLPPGSILTPHPAEFERLFGKTADDLAKLNLALEKARELNIYIILKGHYTLVADPKGQGHFNTSGNAGMATAGSGDVLTGILTALLAQGYDPLSACRLGVYLHGLAGDIAARKCSQEAMISGDIIDNLGDAFLSLQNLSGDR